MWFVLIVSTLLIACPASEHVVSPPAPGRVEALAPALAAPPTEAAPVVPQRTFADSRTLDHGIWPELADRVELGSAEWVDRSAGIVIANGQGDGFLFVGGHAVAFVGDATPTVVVETFDGADRDSDGLPDQLDILIGAKKAAINHAAYGSPYREIPYPGGDVPREEGVCTDTVVRAVRNAGVDLQQTLHEDIKRARSAFRMVKTINPNIDHRRVKTLLPHFERQWVELSPDVDDLLAPWLPGDIIFMQTMGDPRPDHIGVVTDELGTSRAPLVINNWTNGYATSPMDIARLVPVTHRFRMRSELTLPAPHGGLEGLLHRQNLTVPEVSTQLLVVTAPGWDSAGATLRRFERRRTRWVQVGDTIGVTVGTEGLASGRGLVAARAPTDKLEGDRRAPAGVFELGTAFGRGGRPYKGAWPYRAVSAADRFVDDPASAAYNTWQVSSSADDWKSAERLDMYELGVVVKHNMPAAAGAGSAIFLHTWQGAPAGTLGCTAMASEDLGAVLAWLDPTKHPVLVQTAGHIFADVGSK